jgi:hypothetical protein
MRRGAYHNGTGLAGEKILLYLVGGIDYYGIRSCDSRTAELVVASPGTGFAG